MIKHFTTMPLHCPAALLSAIVLLKTVHASTVCPTEYHAPSLYHQYCCLSANNGNTIKLRENNHVKIVVCPKAGLPKTLCNSLGIYNDHSCSEVLESFPNATSGYYNITHSNGSIVSVYCDMEGSNCDGNGGWLRVAYINMTQLDATCPQGLYNYIIGGKTLCDKSHSLGGGCSSTFFSVIGLNYTKVCGQVRGYQFGWPDAFYHGYSQNIDGYYVDGVSITHDSNPRQHIWTYAVGHDESRTDEGACPCSSSYTTPSYVGNDYYCESGTANVNANTLYGNDPLWDGQQCHYHETTCCTSPMMPWFIKQLNQLTTDDIELRMCTNEEYLDEATPIDIVEIYIR